MIDEYITPKARLIQALIDHTKRYEISDRAFARTTLGIHPSTWSYIKSGQRSLGPTVLRAISINLPDLRPLVMDYILGKDNHHGQ